MKVSDQQYDYVNIGQTTNEEEIISEQSNTWINISRSQMRFKCIWLIHDMEWGVWRKPGVPPNFFGTAMISVRIFQIYVNFTLINVVLTCNYKVRHRNGLL